MTTYPQFTFLREVQAAGFQTFTFHHVKESKIKQKVGAPFSGDCRKHPRRGGGVFPEVQILLGNQVSSEDTRKQEVPKSSRPAKLTVTCRVCNSMRDNSSFYSRSAGMAEYPPVQPIATDWVRPRRSRRIVRSRRENRCDSHPLPVSLI